RNRWVGDAAPAWGGDAPQVPIPPPSFTSRPRNASQSLSFAATRRGRRSPAVACLHRGAVFGEHAERTAQDTAVLRRATAVLRFFCFGAGRRLGGPIVVATARCEGNEPDHRCDHRCHLHHGSSLVGKSAAPVQRACLRGSMSVDPGESIASENER